MITSPSAVRAPSVKKGLLKLQEAATAVKDAKRRVKAAKKEAREAKSR
jgi:hypothetical protein